MKPTRHLHPDPAWRYVPAEFTDIRKTFERIAKMDVYQRACLDLQLWGMSKQAKEKRNETRN